MSNSESYCIVTEDDSLLEKDLTLKEAEHLLCSYLNHGWDCYITESEVIAVASS